MRLVRFLAPVLVAMTLLGHAGVARGTMFISVRALGTYADTDYNGFALLSGGDSPNSIVAPLGKVISIGVSAHVSQTGAAGDPSAGGAGWPVFATVDGRLSTGPVGAKANFFGNRPDNSVQGAGWQIGQFIDVDGDGDIDNGNTDANATNPAGWILYRGNSSSGSIGPGSTDPNATSVFGVRPDGMSGAPNPTAANGIEYYLGEVILVITSQASHTSTVKWGFRPVPGSVTWFENATRMTTVTAAGTTVSYSGGIPGQAFAVGAGVTIFSDPEPGSGALAGIAIVALVFRRRSKMPC